MSRVEIAPEFGDDSDRIFDHLAQHELESTPARIGEIIQAFSVLESNPLIGRSVSENMRELIIGRGSRGYVALYRYIAALDIVFVLAVRSQREAGYKRG